jgi:hypothetical protein
MDESNRQPGVDTPADSARRIKESAAGAFDRTKEVAMEKAEQGAERVAGTAQSAATALRRAANDLEAEQPWLGTALRKSADGLDYATRSLNGGDLSHVGSDITGFARRQPALFLGASFALGFALARVGKTAIEEVGDGNANEPYPSSDDPYPTTGV